MNRTTKTIAAGAGAVALPLAAALGVTDYFMRTAVDRREPRAYARLRKKQDAPDGPYGFLEPWREKLRTAPHERVETTSHDGLRLVGHWFPCPDAKRVIVAVHGWRSLWYRDFCGVADFWRENGCSVLYVEQRAQGESEGTYITFGLLERYDCAAWLRWVVDRCGETIPLYLGGISMGAATVLMASDMALPGNVRGIMADCGFTSPEAIWRHVAQDGLHLPYRLLRRWMVAVCRRRTGLEPGSFSAADALRHARYPVLFFHGEDDDFVPVEMTYENYEACAAPKEMLIVPGAGHGMSYVLRPTEYEAVEKKFWAEHDGAPA